MCLKAEKSEDKNYLTFNYDVKDGGNKTKWDYSVEDQIIIYDADHYVLRAERSIKEVKDRI